jgi:AraC-like DNA-binding protein
MRHAAELLGNERHMAVRDVAAAVGYRQPAQFAKSFRSRHGVSPSQFRAISGVVGRRRRVREAEEALAPTG